MYPIRVLHILHSMNRGGAENAIMNYYRHIDRSVVQFDFLLTEPEKCQFEDEILALGGRIYRIPLLTMSNPLPYLKAIRSFFKSHPEYRIVHSHTSSKSTFPLWMAQRAGIPVRIAHSHNTHSEKGINGRIRDWLKIPLKRVANHYLACGEEAAKWLYGEKAFRDGRTFIIPNVIECKNFAFNMAARIAQRANLLLSDDMIIIGFIGRLYPQKNPLFISDIFYEFHQLYSKSKLLIVGDGPLKEDLKGKLARYGLANDTIFTGVVPNVRDYAQCMDLFLMPSINEGLPLSLIEAQISGLECFVSTGITREADKTGLVHYLPLDKGAKYWAEYILKHKDYDRKSHLQDLKDAGYDAETSARKLQEYYVECNENL